MRLPTTDGRSRNVDEDKAIKMIRYAIDCGVNFVDTAYPYHRGNSEVVLGKALRDGYRKEVMLSTKAPLFLIEKEGDFERYLHEQLSRLQTDYVDYYLLHGLKLEKWHQTVLGLNLLEKAEKAKREGLIKHIGFSFHDSFPAFKEIIDGYDGWEMCLLQYNYLDMQSQGGAAGVKYAASRGIPVAVMEPLQGGNLAEPPPAIREMLHQANPQRPPYDWALQWLWNQPEISTVLSGMSTMEQVINNIKSARNSVVNSLSPEEKLLLEVYINKKMKDLIVIPCTRCEYCTPCPSGINIPHNITLFNEGYAFGSLEKSRRIYGFFGQTTDYCTQCRECEDRCPQQLEISQWMPHIHRVLGEGEPYRL